MTDKLSLYKGALRCLGETTISTLADDTPSRYTLDEIWDSGIRDLALQSGYWDFATRTVRIEYDPAIEPDFGYTRAFSKPDDWLRTARISANESFDPPLNDFRDEGGYWFSYYDTLYISHISNDADYGYDIASWPINFVRYFEALMAAEGAERITQNRVKKGDIINIAEGLLSKAKSVDAMNGPVEFSPMGSWASSRMSSGGMSRRSGGWQRG